VKAGIARNYYKFLDRQSKKVFDIVTAKMNEILKNI